MESLTTDATPARSARWLQRDLARLRGIQPLARVAFCGSPISARVSLIKARDGGHFAGLQTCGSVHSCNVCAPVIRQDRAGDLGTAIAEWQALGLTAFLVTLTAPHHQGMRLEQGLASLMESWRSMMGGGGRSSTRAYIDSQLGHQFSEATSPALGVVRAIDITWGESAGWHPHYHCVVFARRGVTQRRVRDVLLGSWLKSTGQKGVPAVLAACDVREIRVGKADAAAVALYGMKAGWEVMRIDLKRAGSGLAPWELLSSAIDGDLDALHLWTEYSLTMKGKRASVWSRELHAWFFTKEREDRTDLERSQGTLEDRVVVGHIASSDVKALRRVAGACSALLEAIAAGTWRELLEALGVPYAEGPPPVAQLELFRSGPFVTSPASCSRRYATPRGST